MNEPKTFTVLATLHTRGLSVNGTLNVFAIKGWDEMRKGLEDLGFRLSVSVEEDVPETSPQPSHETLEQSLHFLVAEWRTTVGWFSDDTTTLFVRARLEQCIDQVQTILAAVASANDDFPDHVMAAGYRAQAEQIEPTPPPSPLPEGQGAKR